MSPHYMNPFEFVPLRKNGPKAIPDAILNSKPRYEGFIDYEMKILTPLHIAGTTHRGPKTFEKKQFVTQYGRRVIPGSAVRGMLSSVIEALTGSDLPVYTRGDATKKGAAHPYGKAYRDRHVGHLMSAPDDPSADKLKAEQVKYPGNPGKFRLMFERHNTLPPGYGHFKGTDMRRFLFGYVDEEAEKDKAEKKKSAPKTEDRDIARSGRLMFDDMVLPEDIRMKEEDAWDIEGDAIMGGPNPRANTAWYFTPGGSRIRQTDRGFATWEVLADQVRGRKFYYHQDPAACFKAYEEWKKWSPLKPYKAESIQQGQTVTGRLYFTDLPEPVFQLLYFALILSHPLAHKIGGLKPFGFGSVRFSATEIQRRDMAAPLSQLQAHTIEKIGLDADLLHLTAYYYLSRIMRFPSEKQMREFKFLYPPFHQKGRNPEEKGFALPASAQDSARPEESPKMTLYFDKYQKESNNFHTVMGGSDYNHLNAGD